MENNKQLHLTLKERKEDLDQLADRALILLSFKDTSTQNLRFVLKLLGIKTRKEKRRILNVIFQLIREGFVYVPRGLPQLVEDSYNYNIDSTNTLGNIDLCLLCPYEKLIKEIQEEIDRIRETKK
jgi:SOS response regulatory protein OraA/RecX